MPHKRYLNRSEKLLSRARRLRSAVGQLGWFVATSLMSTIGLSANAADFQVIYDLPVLHEGTVRLVAGPDGALYGTLRIDKTAGNTGAVFRLSPPQLGQTTWVYSTLYEFHGNRNYTGDGTDPNALVLDYAGHLFGTTSEGGGTGFGTAFELVAPSGGGTPWTKTTVFDRYSSAAGGYPEGQIIQSSNGALYGLVGQGLDASGAMPPITQAAYRLTPPASGRGLWAFTTLHPFKAGEAASDFGLTLGQDGALYGGGANWRLIPPTTGVTTWRYEALYAAYAQFEPALDRSLNIYVADGGNSNGTIYRVSPPLAGQSSWTRTDLYSFKNFYDGRTPYFTLAEGPNGSLYGVTLFGGDGPCCAKGEAFMLTSRNGGTTYPWNKVALHVFTGGADGGLPDAGLLRVIRDGKLALFGTTQTGGAHGHGTVYMIKP